MTAEFFANEALQYLYCKWEIDPLLTRIAYEEPVNIKANLHGVNVTQDVMVKTSIPEDKLNNNDMLKKQYIIPLVHRLLTKLEYAIQDFRVNMAESKVAIILAPRIMSIEKTLGVNSAIAFNKENNLVLRARQWYSGDNSSIGVSLDVLCGFKVT